MAIDVQASEEQRDVWRRARGVNMIVASFLDIQFAAPFDLVVCNQVLEHLPHGLLEAFVRKLMSSARVLIASTTLDMPAGTISGHVQDPISEREFRGWFLNQTAHAPPGAIVDYRTRRGGNPAANYTLPNTRLRKRVAAWHQVVVWRRDTDRTVSDLRRGRSVALA